MMMKMIHTSSDDCELPAKEFTMLSRLPPISGGSDAVVTGIQTHKAKILRVKVRRSVSMSV